MRPINNDSLQKTPHRDFIKTQPKEKAFNENIHISLVLMGSTSSLLPGFALGEKSAFVDNEED